MPDYPGDLTYFRQREREAARLARCAPDKEIAAIHLQMACDYRTIIEKLDSKGLMPDLKEVREG